MPSNKLKHRNLKPQAPLVPPRRGDWSLVSSSPQRTHQIGHALGHVLRGGETVALFGPLGVGKTALVRGLAAGLGAPPTSVASPTFVLIHEYQGRLPLAHMDWYRLHSLHELESTGLLDYFSGPTVTVIEWAENGLDLLPQDRVEITLTHQTVHSRRLQLRGTGPTACALLTRARAQDKISNKKEGPHHA